MSKCTECKYEYLSKCEEPCKYCRERFGKCNPNYLTHRDEFEPKEEQPTTEYKGCDGCYYEWLGESDAPCCDCKYRFDPGTMARLKAKDCFKPKEEKAEKAKENIRKSKGPSKVMRQFWGGVTPIIAEFESDECVNEYLGGYEE